MGAKDLPHLSACLGCSSAATLKPIEHVGPTTFVASVSHLTQESDRTPSVKTLLMVKNAPKDGISVRIRFVGIRFIHITNVGFAHVVREVLIVGMKAPHLRDTMASVIAPQVGGIRV